MARSLETTERASGWSIAVEPDFSFLSDDYRQLFEVAIGPGGGATAFQAPLWMHRLNSALAPKRGARQHTITVRARSTGRLVAVFPFVVQSRLGVRLVMPADFGLCDSNGVVAGFADLEAMAGDDAFKDALDQVVGAAGLLIFRKIRDDQFPIMRLFRKVTETVNDNAAYHCEIGEDFEAWRRTVLRKKFIKERKRQLRQLEREVGAFEHRLARDAEEIAAAFAFARQARKGRFENDLFLVEPIFRFYRDYAIAAAESGEATTYVAVLGGEIIGLLFGLSGDGGFHAVLIVTERERFERFSPGLHMFDQVIRQRHEAGHRVFDMGLGGGGRYKQHFGPRETVVRNFTVSHSLPGTVLAGIYNHAKPLKNALRRVAPHIR